MSKIGVDANRFLEDFRKDSIGRVRAHVSDGARRRSGQVEMTFEYPCIQAFYQTCQQVELLEKSTQKLNQGSGIQICVGMWFLAIEAYINSLLRLACQLCGESFLLYQKKQISTRLDDLICLLGVNKKPVAITGFFQRMQEFTEYRNELFHDRTGCDPLKFREQVFLIILFTQTRSTLSKPAS